MAIHLSDRRGGLFEGPELDHRVALREASLAIEVEVQALYLAELGKSVEDVVLLDFFVEVGGDEDPSLDR